MDWSAEETLSNDEKAKALKILKKLKEDVKILVQWFSGNITKLRPTGISGNNFSKRKQSHEPFGTHSSLGGFGERKFSGYTTASILNTPSRTTQTAIRLLKPLQLAK